MREHPYRAAPARPASRAKVQAWAVVVVVLWIASVARVVAGFVDGSFAGPVKGLAIVLAVGIPFIAANAKVLARAHDD